MKELIEELDLWQQGSQKALFWWRSDDIAKITHSFEKLLEIQSSIKAPISLATIPEQLTDECHKLIYREPGIHILQHGYSHQNYASSPDERVELGGCRSLYEILEEMEKGRTILLDRFDSQFLSIMVPPWHNVHPIVAYFLTEVGLEGISLKEFQSLPLPFNFIRLNVHLDVIEWKPKARFKGRQALIEETVQFLKKLRLNKSDYPILGFLTHHDFHDAEAFDFIYDFVKLIQDHPASKWVTSKDYRAFKIGINS